MSGYDETSMAIYRHFEGVFWLDEAERISLGTAFRLAHRLAVHLANLDFSAAPLKVSKFQHQDFYCVQELARFALDSAVGDLLQLVGKLAVYTEDEEVGPPMLDYDALYLSVPDHREVFRAGIVSKPWMDHFQCLCTSFVSWDDAMRRLPTDLTNIRALCFHAYRLTIALHAALTTVNCAALYHQRA